MVWLPQQSRAEVSEEIKSALLTLHRHNYFKGLAAYEREVRYNRARESDDSTLARLIRDAHAIEEMLMGLDSGVAQFELVDSSPD